MALRPVIVGAGPAGIAAAVMLASHGVDCTVIDEAPRPGGVVYRVPARAGLNFDHLGTRFRRTQEALHTALQAAHPRVDLRSGSRVVGGDPRGWLHVLDGAHRLQDIPWSHLILATGCHERSVPFPGWTLPGVMLLGGLQLLLKNEAILPRGPVVLVGSGPLLPLAACQLLKAGADVCGVFEAASLTHIGRQARALLQRPQQLLGGLGMLAWLRMRGVPVQHGWGIVQAAGADALTSVTVAPYDAQWRPDTTRAVTLPVSTLGVGHGFLPRTQLGQQLGLAHVPDAAGGVRPVVDAWQRSSQPQIHVAGDGAGLLGGDAAMISGRIAALSILMQCGVVPDDSAAALHASLLRSQARFVRFRRGLSHAMAPGPGLLSLPRADTIICRCEAIQRHQIDRAVASGVQDMAALKMRTRAGMGDCQGAQCAAYCADRLRADAAAADPGWLRPRFPIDPLPFSALLDR